MKHSQVLFALICLGCGPGSSEPVVASEAPQTPAEPPAPVYDVHEWGLIDASAHRPGIELSAGPGARPGNEAAVSGALELHGYGKPVLYFHVDGELDEFDVRLDVSLPNALVLAEHFPPGQVGESLRWDVRLRRAPCTSPRVYPTSESDACTGVSDGYCEASELGDYEAADAACISVAGAEWPLLFYRGSPHMNEGAAVPFDGLPLEASVGTGGTVTVRNRRTAQTMQPAIGRIWRVVQSGGRVLVKSVDWPLFGESVEIARPESEEELPLARAMLRDDLTAHGLRPTEIEAFKNAWMVALFGEGAEARNDHPADQDGQNDESRRSVGGEAIGLAHGESPFAGLGDVGVGRGGGGLVMPVPPDVLLYWMPPADVDSLAHLEFVPAPRALRRAALIRVNLVR